ncbi:MAG: type II toxin-antitoxin system VapB family antitoxin [Sphingomonadaceae bacterium]
MFRSNRSQAVRLPKVVAFPEDVREVWIPKRGRQRVIVPADAVWIDIFGGSGIDLPERDQPEVQVRQGF